MARGSSSEEEEDAANALPVCEPAVDAVCSSADLLKLLFTHLDMAGLCRVAATCQLWLAVSQSDDFWRALDFQGRGVQRSQASCLFCSAGTVTLSPACSPPNRLDFAF